MVEHWTENPSVTGSIPVSTTIYIKDNIMEWIKFVLFIVALYCTIRFITGGFLWYQWKTKPSIFTKEVKPLSYNIGIIVAIIITGLLVYIL